MESKIVEFFLTDILTKCAIPVNHPMSLKFREFKTEIIRAFTHSSYESNNPDITGNYEQFEHLGDTAMKTVFAEVLCNEIPEIDEARLTKLRNTYLSTSFQAKISDGLRLYDHVLILPELKKIIDSREPGVREKIAEDLLESIFGLILKVGNKIQPWNGYGLCANFMNTIIIPYIDVNVIYPDEITEIKEMFERMGYKGSPLIAKTTEVVRAGKHMHETELRFNRDPNADVIDSIKLFRNERNNSLMEATRNKQEINPEFIKINYGDSPFIPDVAGRGLGKLERESNKAAHRKAKETLKNIGITSEIIDDQLNMRLIEEYRKKYDILKSKMERDGLVKLILEREIKLKSDAKTTNLKIHRLQGLDKEGRKHVISSYIYDPSTKEPKGGKQIISILINKYLEK